MSLGRHSRLIIFLAALLLSPLPALAQGDYPMQAIGTVPEHGSFSYFPWEHIDAYTGNVLLTFTDFVLPGNAGFNLAVTRTYNTKTHEWRWAVGPNIIGMPATAPYPVVQMEDGTEVHMFRKPGTGNVFFTPSFWRFTSDNNPTNSTLELTNGIVCHFDVNGRLTRMEDAFGNLVEVSWNYYTLTSVVQHVGTDTRTITFEPDENGRMHLISCQGRTWEYHWAPVDPYPNIFNLSEAIPPTGPTAAKWTFTYQFIHQIDGPDDDKMTITLPTGGWVRYWSMDMWNDDVDRQFRTRKLRSREFGPTASGDAQWMFTYTDHGRVTDITSTAGASFWGQATHDPLGPSYTTPLVQYLGSTGTDGKNFQWTTGADPGDVEVIDGIPTGDDISFVPLTVRTSRAESQYLRTYTYTGSIDYPVFCHFNSPTKVEDTGEYATTIDYEYQPFTGSRWLSDRVSLHKVNGIYPTTFEYDPNTGFLTKKNVYGIETRYTPTEDGRGNVWKVIDAKNHETWYTYRWGAVTQTATPEYTIDFGVNEFGETTSTTRGGNTTTFDYDALGRQTLVQPPGLGVNGTVTSYASNGRSVTVSRGSSWTRTDVDEFGRAVATQNSVGVWTAIEYDGLGRVAKRSLPYTGSPVYTHFEYDGWNRVTLSWNDTDGSGHGTGYNYPPSHGQQIDITDGNGNVTHQHWHASGTPDAKRLESVTDARGSTTSYEYDVLGSLTHVNQDNESGAIHRFWAYNGKHLVESQTQPELGICPNTGVSVWYEYDAVGNLQSQRDATCQTTTYDYDGNNRLMHIYAPDATTSLTYYDSDNRHTVVNDYVNTTYYYDAADRMIGRDDVVNSHFFNTGFTPDGNGNVTEILYPSGNRVRYEYDTENRITHVYDLGREMTFVVNDSVSYHSSGGLAGYTSGDGTVHTITYDALARPSSLTAQNGATNILNLGYLNYDHVGNVGTITDSHAGDASFGYDQLDRLTSATGGGWGSLTYGYDKTGNRTSSVHNGTTTSYSYISNRLIGVTGEPALGYDDNGNLTSNGVGTYEYTSSNMLRQATVSGAVYTYQYDGDNQRTVKMQGSQKTTYYLHGLGEVLSEFEQQGTTLQWTVDYVYLGSRLLAALLPATGTVDLTIERTGTGTGTVTSTPPGISCGAICSASYTTNQWVTLTATGDAGSQFAAWEGPADCSDGRVMMDVAKTCRAVFRAVNSLNVQIQPGGAGIVTSDPSRINCPGTCSATYEVGTPVTLGATAGFGWRFAGWSGEDPDCSDGHVTMDSSKSCTATFIATAVLTVQKLGNGATSGTVTSAPPGINCGATCSATYDLGQTVTMTATAPAGFRFVGWSGGCTSNQIVLTGSTTCNATFTTWTNAALATNSAAATASSTYSAGYPTAGTINGDRKGLNWGNGGGWNDANRSVYPDWLQIDFIGAQAIEEIDVFTLQDNYQNPVEPTLQMTQTVWGLRAFQVQYWTGSDWQAVPNGTVTGNNKVWRQFAFSPITTSKIRVWVTLCGFDDYSRIVEVEAWTASFTVPQFATLTVTKAGSGSGTVTTTPSGIECGSTCSAQFDLNQSVTLTATETPGSHFDGWSGDADCSDGQVTMNVAKTCTATFSPSSHTLSITKSGEGTVTSDPGGISCGGTCSASYTSGTPVTLYAQAAPSWVFAGWSGDADCSDGQVTMSEARNCTATFTLITYPLWVEALTTEGMPYYDAYLSSDPTGIDCGSTCTVSFAQGTVVTLFASPEPLYWSGDPQCEGGSVTMTTSRHCVAVYDSGGYFMESLLVMLGTPPQDLTTTADGVSFDVNGTGERQRVGWTPAGSNVGLLALDLNGNGRIDTRAEVFGVSAPGQARQPGENAFTRLAAYDRPEVGGNGDGVLTAADAVFGRLRVWVDRNHDGASQSSELLSLAALGITQIELTYTVAGTRDRAGNVIRARGIALRGRRGTFVLWDAALRVQAATQEVTMSASAVGTVAPLALVAVLGVAFGRAHKQPIRALIQSAPRLLRSTMRRFLSALIVVLLCALLLPHVAVAAAPQGVSTICARGFKGVVHLDGKPVRGATVEALVGAEQRMFLRATMDRYGRFLLSGALPEKDSQWMIRITVPPGHKPVLVKLKIDPTCSPEPDIVLTQTPAGLIVKADK